MCSLWFRSGGHKSHQVFEAFVSCSTYESSTPLGWTYIQKQENISKSNISILDHLGMAQSRKPYCVFKDTLETKLGEFCAQPCLVCLLHMVIARRSRPYDSRLVLTFTSGMEVLPSEKHCWPIVRWFFFRFAAPCASQSIVGLAWPG